MPFGLTLPPPLRLARSAVSTSRSKIEDCVRIAVDKEGRLQTADGPPNFNFQFTIQPYRRFATVDQEVAHRLLRVIVAAPIPRKEIASVHFMLE